eukprot:GFUD01023880.1.p1 GENE.GFUD01023880.1~~GFUD01023880.1.p1  ORF type:complete len:358 (+),score=101.82 GFUD01023880.1:50-1075(+)
MGDKSDKKSLYKKTFKTMEQNMKNFLEQVDDTSPEPKFVTDFDFSVFCVDLNKICDKLSFEANKISLSWLSPPAPSNSDMVSMGSCLELACVATIAAFHSFPTDAGLAVRISLKEAIKNVIESCLGFVKTLNETLGKKFPANSHPILQSFGLVMSKCEAIKKLPKSNKMACIVLIKDQYDILKDALSELEEVKNGDFIDDFGDSAEQWTENDHQVINPSIGLIKTSIVLVKKCSDTIKKSGLENSSEYDTALENINKLSPLVDDLALSLYPPLDWSECKQSNQILKASLEEVLLCLSTLHFMQSEDAIKWREFVGKAVIHNFSEIQRVFITQGMAEIKVSE